MKKQIQKYGDAWVIRFSPEERRIYDINEGDIFDIEMFKNKKLSRLQILKVVKK